jgi:hypothetical protein
VAPLWSGVHVGGGGGGGGVHWTLGGEGRRVHSVELKEQESRLSQTSKPEMGFFIFYFSIYTLLSLRVVRIL